MNIRLQNFAAQDSGLHLVQDFFSQNLESVTHAASLLGGFTAYQRCLRLASDLRQASRLCRHLRYEVVWLHKLLMLDAVGDPDAVETAHFSEIDPADPIVHELCLVADAVGDLLETLADLSDVAIDDKQDGRERDAA